MPEILISKHESIPKELKNIDLDDKYIFLSTKRAVMYYYEEFWRSLYEPKQRLQFINLTNKIITIFHNAPQEYSIFYEEEKEERQYATGSIEKDVIKIFNQQIIPRKAIPAGYLKRVYSKLDHIPDLLPGKIFKKDHLDQKVISFDKYINYLKTLK